MDPQTPPTQPNVPPVVSPTPLPVAPQNKSKKKLLVIAGVVLVLVIVIVAVLLGHHKKTTTSGYDPENHKYDSVVTLTQDGFVPATMTIKPSTEVFFENKAINPVEPDEAAGPRSVVQSKAATQEPHFSSGQIASKSGYGHTFLTPGTYQFYDSQAPTHSVTIIVAKN